MASRVPGLTSGGARIGIKLAPGCAGRVCHAWRETCRNPNKCTNATIKRAKGPLAQTQSQLRNHASNVPRWHRSDGSQMPSRSSASDDRCFK